MKQPSALTTIDAKLNIRQQYEHLLQQHGSYSAVLHLIRWLKERKQASYNNGQTNKAIDYKAVIADLSKLYTERDIAVILAKDRIEQQDVLATWSHIIEQYVAHNLDKDIWL